MDEKNKCFEIFTEHLMKDEKPSEFLKSDFAVEAMDNVKPFTMLKEQVETPQSLVHHPEGSVWNHTLLVVDEAAKRRNKSKDPMVFMWAALLHDIGKPVTTKMRKGRYTSYDHDVVGKVLTKDFLNEIGCHESFTRSVSEMVRWHMQILFVVKDMPFADMENMLKNVSLQEISLLSLCDRLGRGNNDESRIIEEEKNVSMFMNKCREFAKRKENPLMNL